MATPVGVATAPSIPLEYGSDVVVAMLKAYGIPYVALNPGASYRGLHDSLVNYGGNHQPEVLTCCHEEIAVAMAHGYYTATGRIMAAAAHNIVGLQHATIAIYHAWVDRAPILVLGGTGPVDTAQRRPWIDWIHTANVQGNLVRDFTKWDDQPASPEAIPRSLIRAYQMATAEPCGPVYLCYDAGIQEQKLTRPLALPEVAQHPQPTRLQADSRALDDVAAHLVAARNPVLMVEHGGRYEGAAPAARALAELLGAPVVGKPGRFVLPARHPLNAAQDGAAFLKQADALLAVEASDLFGSFFTGAARRPSPGPKPIPWMAHLTLGDLGAKAWSQEFQELAPLDLEIRADAGLALPSLLERVRERMSAADHERAAERRAIIGQATAEKRATFEKRALADSTTRPITLPHVALQLRNALEPHPWTIVKGALRNWLWRMLPVEEPAQWVGLSESGGLGCGLGFALGCSLAFRDEDRIPVAVLGDGDVLFTPSALWTAAHHRLPLLVVVVNNRTYWNSEGHALQMAEERGRPSTTAGIGTRLDDPPADFAAISRAFGLAGEGPIEDPAELLPALQRAARIVREERRLVMVDVVCAND